MKAEEERLTLESRYIHTGNSGVTIKINRDVERPTRAIIKVSNGAHGAFSTEMEIRGNDYDGMSADQLRDLALIFLEGAHKLDLIGEGERPHYEYVRTPNILSVYGTKKIPIKKLYEEAGNLEEGLFKWLDAKLGNGQNSQELLSMFMSKEHPPDLDEYECFQTIEDDDAPPVSVPTKEDDNSKINPEIAQNYKLGKALYEYVASLTMKDLVRIRLEQLVAGLSETKGDGVAESLLPRHILRERRREAARVTKIINTAEKAGYAEKVVYKDDNETKKSFSKMSKKEPVLKGLMNTEVHYEKATKVTRDK